MRATHLTAMILFLAACAPAVDYAAEEQRIRDLDQRWVEAVAAGDAATIVTFYAEDGYFMAPNQPQAHGREAIQAAWAGLFQLPNARLTFGPTEIGTAKAGDLAYDIGTYNLAFDGPAGRVEDNGKYVVVWEKTDAGEWKVLADIFNSNQPAP